MQMLENAITRQDRNFQRTHIISPRVVLETWRDWCTQSGQREEALCELIIL
jgi:hypothetical protein